MKRSLAFILALSLALCCAMSAQAATSVLDKGTLVDGTYYFGEGKNTYIIGVMPDMSKEEMISCVILSDEDTLLEAMKEHELVKYTSSLGGEHGWDKWFYNVTKVLDYEADYDKDGTYWQIAYLDEQKVYKLEDPIQKVDADDYDMVIFMFTK